MITWPLRFLPEPTTLPDFVFTEHHFRNSQSRSTMWSLTKIVGNSDVVSRRACVRAKNDSCISKRHRKPARSIVLICIRAGPAERSSSEGSWTTVSLKTNWMLPDYNTHWVIRLDFQNIAIPIWQKSAKLKYFTRKQGKGVHVMLNLKAMSLQYTAEQWVHLKEHSWKRYSEYTHLYADTVFIYLSTASWTATHLLIAFKRV